MNITLNRHRADRQTGPRILAAVLAILLTSSFAAAQGPPTAQGAAAAQDLNDYVVGPNDVLAITVIDRPQLTGKYIVRADGTFTFPLLGRVKAGGLTLQAVETDVRDKLANGYLKDPQVGISVDQFRSQQVFVMGEVRQPGTLPFSGSMRLVEALARAGSVTERAGTTAIIVRVADGAPPPDAAALARAQSSNDPKADGRVIRVSLQFLQNGTLADNIALRAGDTIFVPRVESVFVSGEVRSPGEYPIRQGLTVREVVALAGGVIERGSTRRIQILREVNGVETTYNANLKDLVQVGDHVVVRGRLF